MNYRITNNINFEIVKTTAAADAVNVHGTLSLAKQDVINRIQMIIAGAREEIKAVRSLRDRDLADEMADDAEAMYEALAEVMPGFSGDDADDATVEEQASRYADAESAEYEAYAEAEAEDLT